MGMSNREVAHQWAHQAKARGTGSNFYYDGPLLFSYGRHFCVGRILPGGRIVVLSTRGYSPSTQRHQSYASSATHHLQQVYAYDANASAEENMAHASRQVRAAIEEALNPKKREPTRLRAKEHAKSLAEAANTYLAVLPASERRGVKPLPVPEFTNEEVDAYRKLVERERRALLARQRREKKAREEQERQRAIALSERLALWRNHEVNGYVGGVMALRLSKDGKLVETSQGANIPVTHAKRLWPVIVKQKGAEESLVLPELKLGVYRGVEIRGNGNIVVGCHHIPFAETEGIARQLGLLEEVAA